jgi:hypothetical protein
MTMPRSLRRRLCDERGITVLLSLFVLTVTTLIMGAVYQAVSTDTQGTRLNLDQARAYAAAQAGIAAYTYQLNQNPNYWQQCNTVTANVPNGSDNGSTETYTYRPIPASTPASHPPTACSTSNPYGTMIEDGTSAQPGTFRIAFTGTSALTGTLKSISRTVVATFKQPSFLNYVYYTQYETLDPAALYNPSNNPSEPTDCAAEYPNRGSDCGGPIDFVSGDALNGPVHSEDTIAVCGSNGQGPTFGRSAYNDPIEAAGVSTEGQNGCSLTYTVNNTTGAVNTQAPAITTPATNTALLTTASSGGYVYTGRTTIVLNGSTMSVTTASAQTCGSTCTGNAVAWPSNGVIYVKTATAGCPVTYTPFTANSTYPPADNNCGNVYVSGNYTKSLTIASDNDIVINGNITTSTGLYGIPTGGQLLGLVANDFVRLYHPVTNRTGTSCPYNAANGTGSLQDPQIYAAILAVNHSFIVDNYDCGAQLGTLTVWGAIAQLFRGPVGRINSSGYLKSYNYDDRLAYSEPPYFLAPTSTAWYVSRISECGSSC